MKRWWARLRRLFGPARIVGIGLLIAFAVLRILDPAPVEAIRLRGFDVYQIIRPNPAPARPVTIVDIDEESLRSIGQWPWPRTTIADLIAQVTRMGGLVVGFDVLFAEPDRMSPQVAAGSFRGLDAETKDKLMALPGNDTVMAAALSRARVVLGQSGFHLPLPESGPLPQTAFATIGQDPSDYLITFPGLLRNVPELERAAAGRGLFTIRPERDGIVRRVPLVMKVQDRLVPGLTLDMLRVVTGAGVIRVKADEAGIRSVAVPGLEIPTDRNGQLWVYLSKHDPARFVSAKSVLDGTAAPDRFAQKLVIVGTSAVGLLDLKTTAIDPAMPGVEVQAQVIENALTGSSLSYPNYMTVFELAAALSVGIAIIVLAPKISAAALMLLGLAITVILLGVSWLVFVTYGVLLDVTYALMSSFSVYLAILFINYFREQMERRRIRSAFGQYISPTLVEQLAQSPEKLKLGGEEKNMTILFSDVRGFTTISESYKHDPQGLTQLMNRFLDPLTNAIINQKGTIDKYIGDAIMAFWNAPLDDTQHEINSCRAALDMLREVDDLNRAREEEAQNGGHAFIPINVGIGINTGQCVVGNMGSKLRFDYSVLGDAVNLASRLEGRSRAYGTPIIIGSTTAQRIGDEFATLEIDLITVKGKKVPERIFTVLGDKAVAESEAFLKLKNMNETMLASYRRRDWNAALEQVQLCRFSQHTYNLEELYVLYLARIQAFLGNAPPDDWDGVFAFETK